MPPWCVTRVLALLKRFYCWVDMKASTHLWIRRCFECQARKTSRQTVHWPFIFMGLPNSPDTLASSDYFSPLPTTGRRNTYILFSTDLFTRHASMSAVTPGDLTTATTVRVLVHEYMKHYGCPKRLPSYNDQHVFPDPSDELYNELVGICKISPSLHHPNDNGGTARVNHTMAHMLTIVVHYY